MNKTLALVAALGLVAAPAFASSETAVSKETTTKVVKEEVKSAAPAAAATHAELKDGTKVVIKGEDVFVVGKDGKETPAPDAKHELKDGSFVTTKGGKIVK